MPGARGVLSGFLAVVLAASAAQAGTPARAEAPPVTIAVIGEDGLDPLHREFATRDGRDVRLPAAISAKAVRVDLPRGGSYSNRHATMLRGPLGRMKANTLYYVRGTRLVIWTGTRATGAVDKGDQEHGTGVASLAGGRTTGHAPDALIVMALDHFDLSWAWMAQQSWIDVGTSSAFDPLVGSAPVVCLATSAVKAVRQSGRLPFLIAGNGPYDTTVSAIGQSPHVVRVGGVNDDGTSRLPGDGSSVGSYSGRGYDIAERYAFTIAKYGTADGYVKAGGTSGSTPLVASRTASLIAYARRLVGDTGIGARGGALVVAQRGAKAPARGPLSDGKLTADELLAAQLAAANPARAEPTRYTVEGYGFFGDEAQALVEQVIAGRAELPERAADDLVYSAALAARQAATLAKGCI